jgi:3-methyladenine DNA glycosylase/8-oxoguanine DNA glycosylase
VKVASAETIETPGVDLSLTLGPLAMLSGDPTIRLRTGVFERGTLTPDGPGAIRVTWKPGSGIAHVETFGVGADWLMGGVPALLGVQDDPSDFRPEHPVVRRLWRGFSGDRVGRTRTLWHDLAWTIVQQRVRGVDAARQWRRLVEALGEPAPGVEGVRVPPEPERIARSSSDVFRGLGIDARRTRALHETALVASRLQRFVDGDLDDARPALLSIPGVGAWSVSLLSAFTWGNPDTVIVGDSGIPSLIASTLAGERRADDSRMKELLEPFRPHRYRVLRLAFAARTRRAYVVAGVV